MSLDTIPNLKHWTSGVEVEQAAVQQLRKMAALPILAGHIAVMPDVHMGTGATVGSVIPTRAAVIPSAIGVDGGCGMAALRTKLTANDLPQSLANLRSRLESVIPVGFAAHDTPVSTHGDGLEGIALHRKTKDLVQRFEKLRIQSRLGAYDGGRLTRQLMSLGGGNHYLEVVIDEEQRVWFVVHSGSRNIGKTIGEIAIEMAKEVAIKVQRDLVDRDLAWLDEGSEEFAIYIEAMHWVQEYAALNRRLMMHAACKAMVAEFGLPDLSALYGGEMAVSCHHNYTQMEVHFGQSMWVTRKGAVSARAGEMGIIPGSMGAKSYIVRGRGHEASYCSCSHGAGRRMSRGQAKRQFSLTDLVAQTQGVECRQDAGVLDEIPGAYKDIDAVMAAQGDLVEVVHTLKQCLCIKG